MLLIELWALVALATSWICLRHMRKDNAIQKLRRRVLELQMEWEGTPVQVEDAKLLADRAQELGDHDTLFDLGDLTNV